jgi:hypothetical protein
MTRIFSTCKYLTMLQKMFIDNSLLKMGKLLLLLLLLMGLVGCTSFGKGAMQAVLEKTEEEDTRRCDVRGKAFAGIDASITRTHEETRGKTKVLMTHGVGDHLAGYSTEFLEKLARELKLNATSANYIDIKLSAALIENPKNLGNLRISHLFNEDKSRELIFYELTWSDITRGEKSLLSYDNSGEYSFRRAMLNSMLKTFSNDTGPDPIIYLGKSRELILAAFAQAFCWMATRDWEDLPASGQHICFGLDESSTNHIMYDDYIFVSHSLGSRITIDGLQRIAALFANPEEFAKGGIKVTMNPDGGFKAMMPDGQNVSVSSTSIQAFKNKHIPIFMMSNQLPMLQMGRELPKVTGQIAEYCNPSGSNYASRMLRETSIIAFSDPNDLLSYDVHPDFKDKYLDSRLCPTVTSIIINIAKVISVYDVKGLANPFKAHVGYDTDDRVVAMIANGIGGPNTSDVTKKRCEWRKMID